MKLVAEQFKLVAGPQETKWVEGLAAYDAARTPPSWVPVPKR